MLPDFVLAGAQRCGTTSLYRALLDHPAVLGPVFHKGVNYFDVNYEKGPAWYRGHFPVRSLAALRTHPRGDRARTFDASGYYSYHPHAPARLAQDLPHAKILLMLRDPVERAFSAYKHEKARGFEEESFDRAIDLEDERVEPELDKMLTDPTYASFSHRHHSYRRRGQYAEQVQRLAAGAGPDRVLVIESEDFFGNPEAEYRRITDFLSLPVHVPATFDRWNARPGSDMPAHVRQRLRTAFEPHDADLARLTGRPPSWRR